MSFCTVVAHADDIWRLTPILATEMSAAEPPNFTVFLTIDMTMA